jgi:hypothetical protein
MPQFEVNYTPEELQYFEKELRKYKLPWITKVWKKYGVPFIRYSILPALIIIAVFGIIYNNSVYGQNDWMWTVDKAIALFYIFGFGLFTLISHVAELITTNKLRRRLGLSKRDFNIMVITFQITGM